MRTRRSRIVGSDIALVRAFYSARGWGVIGATSAFLAGCSGEGFLSAGGISADSASPESGQSEQPASKAEEKTEVPTSKALAQPNISEDRVRALSNWLQEAGTVGATSPGDRESAGMLDTISAFGGPARVDANEDGPGQPGVNRSNRSNEPAPAENDAKSNGNREVAVPPTASDEFSAFRAKLSPDELVLFEEFSQALDRTEFGYSLEDISFRDGQAVAEYFLAVYGAQVEKTIWDTTKVWPSTKSTFSVAFTDDSDSTTSERQELVDWIDNTWGNYLGVSFTWQGTNGTGECAQSASGSVPACSSFDFAVVHSSTITRGCASVGTDQNFDGVGCSGGPSHAYGTILVPRTQGSGVTTGWRFNTYVHEFGHALGLLHEHQRTTITGGCNQSNGTEITATCAGGNISEALNSNAGTIDSYDGDSVMTYCHCPLTGEISALDVETVQGLLPRATTWPFVAVRGWYADSVALSFTGLTPAGNFSSNWSEASISKAEKMSSPGAGSDWSAGRTYSIVATPGKSRFRCPTVKPGAPYLVNSPKLMVPDFEERPIRVACYDPASISAAINR